MKHKTLLTSVLVIAAALWPSAANADPAVERHCVFQAAPEGRSGGTLDDATCFDSIDEAFAHAGIVDAGTPIDLEALGPLVPAALASGVIGVHWDGANRTGASITISGSACSGGYVNLTNDWINRISSTWNLGPTTRFYDGFNLTGSSETLGASAVNLGSLNNKANSISYS